MDNIIYNPEGSALRRDQLKILNMLLEFDKICKKHNITWWLSSGTLLGAARHKGYIPWDDDVDIVMLKEDYKKLEAILCKANDENYVFHCQKTDVDYVNYFGKFRMKHGRASSNSHRYEFYKWKGIGFDVFAMEKTNTISATIASRIYKFFCKLSYYIEWNVIRKPLIRLCEFICDYLLFPILRLIGKYNPNEEYHYVLGTGWPKHTFYMKYTFPLTTTEFEGYQLPVPKDMDMYLTNVYGDWRKLPTPEQIKHSIHCQEYRDEIFGKGN